MPPGQHPFIDVAVHRQVRARFSRGEGLVLFASDLGDVLWADGEGAGLFGFATPYELMDEWRTIPAIVRRQLQAAASQISGGGGEKSLTLRVASGLRSRTLGVSMIGVALPDGTPALLLTDGNSAEKLDVKTRASRIIRGLGDAGTHVAVLDAAGEYLAASTGMAGLELGADARHGLVEQAATGANGLVKRMIMTGRGQAAAALARLSDEPPLHLLFVVETEPGQAGGAGRRGEDPRASRAEGGGRAEPERSSRAPAVNASANASALAPGRTAEDGPQTPPGSQSSAGNGEASTCPAPGPGAAPQFLFDAAARPVRFVWKIDPECRFSEVSPDFAGAVGPNAADIIGRHFRDVAKVFGFDRDNQISELLQRRDTWSGRTVSWPVQGTGLCVPVDLAALPIYDRAREFQGFRGFGIVRVADAQEDPEAIGLSLTGRPQAGEAAPSEAPSTDQRSSSGASQAADTGGEPLSRPESSATPEERPGEVPEATVDAREDPFRGETPALRIVRPFGRRENDKVIDLDQRRSRTREVLSTGEQQAFREIGARLAKSFGGRPGDDETPEMTGTTEPAPTDAATVAPDETRPPSRPEIQDAPEISVRDEEPPGGDETGPDTAPEEGREAERLEAWRTVGAEDAPRRTASQLPSAFATAGTASAPARLSTEIVDDLPLALLVHDGHAIHYANVEFFQLTGYPDLAALADAGGLAGLFADLAEEISNGAFPGTLQLVRDDDTEIPVHARLQSIQWNGKRALMLSLVPAQEPADGDASLLPLQDNDNVDTRRESGPAGTSPPDDDAARLAALKIEVEELRSILETATDGVVILGEHGDIRSMNRSASALFDYDESEIRGQPFAKLFAHESQRAVMDYLSGLSEHGVASVLNDGREVIGREASGGFLPLFMTIGRLTASNGFCAVMRDITQWKRTEEELRAAKSAAEQANSHKSAFLARVSHEIRTPLNAIIGFSDLMAEQRFGPIGSPRYLEYARDIGRSGKHVLDIVNDLLDISKIEAGEMDVSFAAVALNDTIAEAVSLMQPQANRQRVIIRTSLSSSVPEIVADGRLIKQIALNLLSNAIRFTPAGGQIVVSTAYESNGSVALRIRDTGVGMSQGELEQAMKPFRQVNGSSRPRGDGTGLGLPLTKAMVEANRAEFDIRSAPNEGTLIEISFPSQRVLAD